MLASKIKSFSQICKIAKQLKKEGKKVVFVHGFFDILHKGHATLLIEAKKYGDVLVVGVDHDDNGPILKGPKRPINNHQSRMFVLSMLEPVDYVFLIPSFKKLKKADNIRNFFCKRIYFDLKPDMVATCVKAGRYGYLKKKGAEAVGAKFVDINHGIYDKKTTKIIELLEKK